MEAVLAVYARPYDEKRPVICLDEKSKELHGTPRGELPLVSGKVKRVDCDYERHGTANLFMQVEPLTGRCRVAVTDRRTAVDFAEQLRILAEEEYPQAEVIVLVTDNLNTHHIGCLYERFAPEQARTIISRIEWHCYIRRGRRP